MHASNSGRALVALACAALTALTLSAAGTRAVADGVASGVSAEPIVATHGGAVRGVAVTGGFAFRGLPYAAPPTGNLRWRPPAPPAHWQGVRDATQFGPSCPQPPSPFLPPGPFSEDCLYLNVNTPALPGGGQDHQRRHSGDRDGRPVLVWIHGGGLTQDAARDYDQAKLAPDGVVAVTINYRLGALGLLPRCC
jgi:para-nitrobenzyl esterase